MPRATLIEITDDFNSRTGHTLTVNQLLDRVSNMMESRFPEGDDFEDMIDAAGFWAEDTIANYELFGVSANYSTEDLMDMEREF